MACYVEEEYDWSDGPLDPPSPEAVGPSRASPFSQEKHDLFVSETTDDCALPIGSPLPFAFEVGKSDPSVPSRVQRAQLGIHLNRRQPSKNDYTNFALYQANQKVYEAAFLKTFAAHALHPDRVTQCFAKGINEGANLTSYLRAVLQNINGIADKMTWNAHSRTVNLLANDGKDGVPFLDVQKINRHMFSDFCSDNPVSVVSRLSESWHRATPEPAMVRMSTKQYPVGANSSPLEEIDEIADRIFSDKVFTSNLPAGRTTKAPVGRKGKGRATHGASRRDDLQDSSRGNWLAFPSHETPYQAPSLPPVSQMFPTAVEDIKMLDNDEPQILKDLRESQYDSHLPYEFAQSSSADVGVHDTDSTTLEDLFSRYGADALDSDRINTPTDSGNVHLIAKVPSWKMRLVQDHRRRLTERWGNSQQTLRRAMPDINQVMAEALAKGIHPTGDDYRRKIKIIAAREQREAAVLPSIISLASDSEARQHQTHVSVTIPRRRLQLSESHKAPRNEQHVDAPRKKQKMCSNASNAKAKVSRAPKVPQTNISTQQQPQATSAKKTAKGKKVDKAPSDSPVIIVPSLPHPSGSKTLDIHHNLPPGAYFEPQDPNEKPAWRCGIKHAMGYYYNAGDRKGCPGCFTNIKDSAQSKHMDFYMSPSSHFFQPAPDIIWTPSKSSNKVRRSKTLSHNSIAKDAYWAAIRVGATADEARQHGVDAVEAHLRPPTLKEPTREPTPEPTPEPDLGPHPSGSATMEHGQDIPESAYFDKTERHEDFAWRCDLNHALGRYYLAGDKRSCPGCGSNRNGESKKAVMDFYMPFGVVVRQEAPGLSRWKPRRRNKTTRKPGATKQEYLSHNQICSRKYFDAFDAGMEHAEAVKHAIEELEEELDAKQAAALEREEESEETGSQSGSISNSSHQRTDSTNTTTASSVRSEQSRRSSRENYSGSRTSKKRPFSDLGDEDMDEGHYESPTETVEAEVEAEVISISSSDDEETSGSDSE